MRPGKTGRIRLTQPARARKCQGFRMKFALIRGDCSKTASIIYDWVQVNPADVRSKSRYWMRWNSKVHRQLGFVPVF